MRTKFLFVILILAVVGCKSKKKTTYTKTRTVTVESKEGETTTKTTKKEKRKNKRADAIVSTALGFSGTKYRFGGTTKKGMDCSGLVYVALKENDISFPRISYQMANEGERIRLKEVQKGDLLFFKTSKSGKRINHVGLVVEVDDGEILFIHSTSSRGVIVSSLREGFWDHSFVKATRIL